MFAVLFGLFSLALAGQETIIKGFITDESTGEPVPGANITIQGKMIGTVSESDGSFFLRTKSAPPFTIKITYIGYASREIRVNKKVEEFNILLKEQPVLGQEVVISASRVEESIMRSPVTVERMNMKDIREIPAANFFDGLYGIKGVDMNVHSLTFRFPNTRGFTGDFNFRMNQLIDGVDNTAPGLSFPAGNIFGLSPIEIESAELLVGASSALYGPGGMNGILLMKSKDPFVYQGLSASLQTGIMHVGAKYLDDPTPMIDFNVRYAKAFKNRFAIRIGATYLKATDWYAADYRDKNHLNNPAYTRETYPGYDGVNVYGDDIIAPVNLVQLAPDIAAGIAEAQGYHPGTQEYEDFVSKIVDKFEQGIRNPIITRTGWDEKNIVDYDTRTVRFNASLHYRITEKIEANIRGTYGEGNSVYTAQNRFAFENFHMTTLVGEIKSPEFYIRAYSVSENSGDTYNAGGVAMQINEAWKPSEEWYGDYISSFTQTFLISGNESQAHTLARLVAENRTPQGTIFNDSSPAFPLADSERFRYLLDSLKQIPVNEGGGKVIDKSRMYHVEGLYNFRDIIPWVELLAGASYRTYRINSEGTVFIDEPGHPVTMDQYGIFTQLSKNFFQEKLKLTLAARYDKNQNFKGRVTPRFSIVYSIDPHDHHNIRASVQTAYRFPSVPDQYTDLNVGPFRVIGGLPVIQEKYGFNTNPPYPLTGINPITDQPDTAYGHYRFPEFKPERVTAFELGYKGLLLNRMMFIDVYGFVNRYNGFLATQVLAQNPYTPDERRFQTTVSTDDPIISFGWAAGIDVLLPNRFFIKANIAYNALESLGDRPPGFQSRFNTPKYRSNFSLGNSNVYKNFGFGISWRWQDHFLWQSAFGVAEIPAFSIIDAQVSYHIESLNTILKAGGSNILNEPYTTSFGSAQVGGLYYFTVLYGLQ